MTGIRRRTRARGFSIVELLISLAITSLLLTATMMALHASFIAYAAAAEQAGTQVATRMVVNRMLTLIRTSTAHGPLTPDATTNPPVTLTGNTISSHFIELIDSNNRLLRMEYVVADQTLYLTVSNLDGSNAQTNPLLSGVTAASFTANRRLNAQSLWVLERATVDLTVVPAADTTLSIERGPAAAIRMIASTMPRKLN